MRARSLRPLQLPQLPAARPRGIIDLGWKYIPLVALGLGAGMGRWGSGASCGDAGDLLPLT